MPHSQPDPERIPDDDWRWSLPPEQWDPEYSAPQIVALHCDFGCVPVQQSSQTHQAFRGIVKDSTIDSFADVPRIRLLPQTNAAE